MNDITGLPETPSSVVSTIWTKCQAFIENILSVQEQVHGSAKSTKKRKSEVVSLNKMISENNVVLHKNTVGTTHTSVQNSLKIEN